MSTSELAQAMQSARLTSYDDFVSFTILLYDYILSLPSEKRYIWSSHLGIGKCLYLLSRYLVFMDVTLSFILHSAPTMTPETCTTLFKFIAGLNTAGILISEISLAYRTWVLWDTSRTMGILLLGLVVVLGGVGLGLSTVTSTVSLENMKFPTPPVPAHVSCWEVSPLERLSFSMCYLVVALGETALISLTVYRLKSQGHCITLTTIMKRPSLGAVLCRDGIMYYAYILAISIFNLFSIIFTEFQPLLIQRVLHSVFISGMFLHLRETGDSIASPSLSGVSRRHRSLSLSLY
ncbi:hypothetical protein M422DRAFT_31917 [Sphaerobolus stellatus SS14]|uniref:Unplaced genomic scaffold SPHSTscaffold_64, whole genome shotgun sequence n=1 Tax=Sphaerobolus stellatus (strain SS14) TaxID=990650 RepID=A0A0C9V1U3_SPHS4|nr:hypothetical protein M422DRAFT_31917 [Sphaerobolus stellatus SS14]